MGAKLMDNSIAESKQHVILTFEEAQDLDIKIVSGVRNILRCLVDMYNGEGYKALGHDNWGEYLGTVSFRAGVKAKALRRWTKAALLEDGTGLELGTFSEGTVRPIIDTLSDRKGFDSNDREAALDLALELSNGIYEEVTAKVARAAAYYIYTEVSTPDAGNDLVDRLKSGEITSEAAYTISGIMQGDDAKGIEHILAQTSDPDLAGFMVGLRRNEPRKWEDIQDTIEMSGHVPTDNGQVHINEATRGDLIDHLNEPQRMKRYEKAVERTEALKRVAELAAKLAVDYWGIHPEVPGNLKHMSSEAELYQLLIDLRYIKYGVVNGSTN
jgi:hypothetical protein